MGRPLLLIVATHPIQYQVPWFRALAECSSLRLQVCYLRVPEGAVEDPGFGRQFGWDIPLMSGYEWSRADADAGLFREFRKLRPDVLLVLGWNEYGLLQAWWSALLLKIPLVVRGDSNSRRHRPWWVRLAHRALLATPARFLTVGGSNAEFYRNAGVPSRALIGAPHFVDNAFFADRAASIGRTSASARWGLRPDEFCILYAGKFEVKKRPFDVLAAVRRLPDALRRGLRVLMVGSGHLEAELKSQAAELGDAVIWAGFLNQTEIPAAYAVADVLILPSNHGETWGLVVNEAMACGVPAIVSDQVGCANDLVRHEQTGLVFPVGNVDALAEAISSLAKDPAHCRRMGAAARELVTSKYTIQASVDAVVRAVRDLTGQSDPLDGAPDVRDDPGVQA